MNKLISLLLLFFALFGRNQSAALPSPESNLVIQDTFGVSDTILKIEKQPAMGFNYPYYLRLPKGLDAKEIQYILVEMNNSGFNDTFSVHEKVSYQQIKKNSLGASLCGVLKTPFLMPVFPRPATEWKFYTHAFDRDAAMIDTGDMKRLDLQLVAMIGHARNILKKAGISSCEKVLMNGFSASGTFANRFTLIHPEIMAATATGGINAITILANKKLGNTRLKYPLGTYDFKKIFGKKLNIKEYKKIPQFIYMGENDNNDAALYDDAYSKEERNIIFTNFGKDMMPARFLKFDSLYKNNGINSTFTIYKGIGHETDQKVFRDVYEFFREVIISHAKERKVEIKSF